MSGPITVAVVGAGVAGLTAARRLAPSASVTLFEKSRGPGGRLAHRRGERFAFDFGAQYFTARDAAFQSEIRRLAALGVVQPWRCRFAEIAPAKGTAVQRWTDSPPHFAGVGRMTAMAAHWAEGLAIERTTRITGLGRRSDRWVLETEQDGERGPFDFVVVAIPAPQAAAILPAETPLKAMAASVAMQGCFALMLGFDKLPDFGFDAARVEGSALSWLSLSQSRPGHLGDPGMVILSDNDWADLHMEEAPERVTGLMTGALSYLIKGLPEPTHSELHRWRYANCGRGPLPDSLFDPAQGLAVCGDWTREGRVEAAYLSGLQAADAILTSLE